VDTNRVVPIAADISQEQVCISKVEEDITEIGRKDDVLINNVVLDNEPTKMTI
jgi:hypothetical protein